MVLFPINRELEEGQFNALARAASALADDLFYFFTLERPWSEDQLESALQVQSTVEPMEGSGDQRWAILFDYGAYSDVGAIDVSALCSPSGRWGVLVSNDDHAVVGGSDTFIAHLLSQFPPTEEPVKHTHSLLPADLPADMSRDELLGGGTGDAGADAYGSAPGRQSSAVAHRVLDVLPRPRTRKSQRPGWSALQAQPATRVRGLDSRAVGSSLRQRRGGEVSRRLRLAVSCRDPWTLPRSRRSKGSGLVLRRLLAAGTGDWENVTAEDFLDGLAARGHKKGPVSRAFLDSPGWTRTNNPPVNSPPLWSALMLPTLYQAI